MAASIDPTDYDAAPSYGGQKKMRVALAEFLAAKDPQGTRRRKADGSNARGQLGVLQQVVTNDPLLVLKALAEPLKQARKRKLGRERVQRYRERLRQEAAPKSA